MKAAHALSSLGIVLLVATAASAFDYVGVAYQPYVKQ